MTPECFERVSPRASRAVSAASYTADEVLHVPIRFPGRDRLHKDQTLIEQVFLLSVVGMERIDSRRDVAALGVEPPAGLRRVVLKRFRQRSEVHSL
jgi:hypothetical protein